ncbi:MAG: hypothetical protein ACMXYE_01060 [Candidatus Woesearchaeota archaeon]
MPTARSVFSDPAFSTISPVNMHRHSQACKNTLVKKADFIAKVKEPYTVTISEEHNDFRWFSKDELDDIEFWQPFYKKMIQDNLL